MWFFSNYFYNSGLANTSVTSSTVLCNTSSIFVYLISLALLETVKFDKLKGLFVLISFSGIVTITLSDEKDDSGNESLKGNVLSLLGAMFYGLYAVILKKKVPDAHSGKFKVSHFLGLVGLINSVLLLPLFFVLNSTGIEPFTWPNRDALYALTLRAYSPAGATPVVAINSDEV